MLTSCALLLLASCATYPQESVIQQGVLRELRIYSLGSLAEQRDLGLKEEQREMDLRVSRYLEVLARAEGESSLVVEPRLRSNITYHPDPDVVSDYAALASRFCEPALNPKEERIQPDAQGYLIAYLQPAQHDWLSQFLALQRAPSLGWVVELEAHIYTVPQGVLVKMGLEGSATLLADADAIRKMQDTLTARSADELVAPKLTLFPNQRGNMSAISEVAYIKSYELQIIEPGSIEIADPIVDVIKEGFMMSVRALQVSDGLYGLEIESVTSEVERPIPTKKIKLSPLHPTEVEIGLPQVRTATVNATVRLADGAGVLLIASGLAKDRDMAILLTFRRASLPPQSAGLPER